MQPNLNNDLITYSMTEDEVAAGAVLNSLQKAVLQNEKVELIRQLASLTPDSMSAEGKESYWQQEAYLRGQADILTHQLAKANAVSESSESNQS